MPGTPERKLSPAAENVKQRLKAYCQYNLIAASALVELHDREQPIASEANDYMTWFVLHAHEPVTINRVGTLLKISWDTAKAKLLSWEAAGVAILTGNQFTVSDQRMEEMAVDHRVLDALDRIEAAMGEAVDEQRALRRKSRE